MLQEAEKDIPYPPAEARAAPGRLAACISAAVLLGDVAEA